MAACLLSLSLSDCWLYCSQLWCRSCGIQITSVISLEALCAWLARADIWYRIDHSPPSPPQSPFSPTLPVPSSYLHLPFILGGWHTRELWDQLSWVELGEAIAGLLHPLTWPPQWAFVRSARAKPHPSSSNGFWSATGSIRHYCYAWVKATDTQAGRQRRERVEVRHGSLEKASTAEQSPHQEPPSAPTRHGETVSAERHEGFDNGRRRSNEKGGPEIHPDITGLRVWRNLWAFNEALNEGLIRATAADVNQ